MNNLTNNKLWISFLPWAELKESVKIGPITFWPYFGEDNQNKIADPEIKASLNKLFDSFVDNQGKPVETITICSYNNDNLYELTDSKYKILREVVDILIFSFIASATKIIVSNRNHGGGWLPPTADTFELFSFRLPDSLQDNFISFQIDYSIGPSINVYEIGNFKLPKPYTTGGPLWLGFYEKLIDGFDNFFSHKFHEEDERNRLFRSLEWFRLAHENAQFSKLSKIVMMATAFEILLKFGKEKKEDFVKYMENNIASDHFLKDTRTDKKEKHYTYSLAGWWAWDFYNLRNHIVHGDNISAEELIYNKDPISHLVVADLVFSECIIQKLIDYNCIGNDIHSSEVLNNLYQNNESKDKCIESWIKWTFGFDAIYEALGWIHNK